MPEEPQPDAPAAPARRMPRWSTAPRPVSLRSLLLTLSAVGVVVLTALAALLPVPYVALGPGPTENTLGKLPSGQPLITIKGHQTYPASGHLNLVTVSVSGGPTSHLDLLTALRGWLDPAVAVVPVEAVFPSDSSAKEIEQQNVQEMQLSQQDATVVALHHLGIPVTSKTVVRGVVDGSPSDGVLKPGDVIIEVDGVKATSPDVVRKTIEAHKPGDTIAITVERDGATKVLSVTATKEGDRTVVGFYPDVVYTFPFTVEIDPGNIGGPSAGMMFTLGLIDKLTPGDLTGGKFVAGTGTIDLNGNVGPIGGIHQKMVGARGAGARYFLTPAKNCDEALGAVPAGLQLVKVTTLDDALKALDTIRTGKGTLPSCRTGA